MAILSSVIREIWLAAGFLTRLPIGFPSAGYLPTLARIMRWFPLVGAFIGMIGGGVGALALIVGLPPFVGGLAAVAATILLTGALHEDGLADCADGLGGGRDRDSKLAILRDSRIGSYGALALIVGVGARAALLGSCQNPAELVIFCATAHGLSRATLPWMQRYLPQARSHGLSANAGRPDALGVALTGMQAVVLAFLLLGGLRGLFALLGMILVSWWMGRVARRQIGGITGDVLGATEQLIEILVLGIALGALRI